MDRIAKSANSKQVCCMDFLINDIAKSSLKQAAPPKRSSGR
jgi:hypothetical protein